MKTLSKRFTLSVLCCLMLALASCGGSDGPTFDVTPPSIAAEGSNPSDTGVSVSGTSTSFLVSSPGAWTITSPEWIVCNPASGEGAATVRMTIAANTGADRSGSVSVKSGSETRTFTIKQEGVPFGISANEFAFDAQCSPIEMQVVSKYDWNFVEGDIPAWLTISPVSGKPGQTTVKLTPKPFTDRVPREKALITLKYTASFTMIAVSQELPNNAPAAPVLKSPAAGESGVSINASFSWEAAADPDGDEVTYRLMVSPDGSNWYTATTTATSSKLNELLAKQTPYTWKVEASDPFGAKSESQTATFTTGDGGAYADGEVVRWQTESAGAPKPVHLVFTGDGFIADDYVEGGAFDQAVETAINALFSLEPYKSYRNYFRISTVAAYSEERGTTILGDKTDGSKKQTRNTIFESKIEGGNSTGTSCNYDKVFAYAQKVPGVTQEVLNNTTVFVLINQDVYAGTCLMMYTGASVSMCPMGKDSFGPVVQHEGGGHGFGRLLDEYRYYNEQLPASEKSQLVSWRQGDPYYGYNISLTADRSQVHWKHYFDRSGYESVGLYEGACLYSLGVWRPEYISCMEDNRPYYNAPSREAIVRRICKASGKTFSLDEFFAKDAGNSAGAPAAAPTRTPEYFVPLAPPILIDNRK